MGLPNQPPTQEQIALKMVRDLERLRDALVNLSLVSRDWVFEANRSEDVTAACKANSIIEKMMS